MTLSRNDKGQAIVTLRRKMSVEDADEQSSLARSESLTLTLRNNSLGHETEIVIFTRGQSFENERGCDEIMQQFINGLESEVDT